MDHCTAHTINALFFIVYIISDKRITEIAFRSDEQAGFYKDFNSQRTCQLKIKN